MGNLAKTYRIIADILATESNESSLAIEFSNPNFDWDNIVVKGSQQVVLPAICCRLKEKELLSYLPEQLQNYLEYITTINRNRNITLLRQIKSISQILNQNSIEHVFLKGAALLASGCYKDNAERMVGDIDILVKKNQVLEAFDLLKNNGYNKTSGFAYDNKDFRHLDRLISEKELAAIELHSELLENPNRDLIDLDSVFNSKKIVNNITIPNDYYINKHQIIAWQTNNYGYYFRSISFKLFYDSIVLNAFSDKELISDLFETKFGQGYLATAKFYFQAFSSVNCNSFMESYTESHNNYVEKKIFRKVLKPAKYAYLNIKKRLILIANNVSYRKHILNLRFIFKK
ncbi:nucleotidyltransferase family protein [Winogradskyella sp. SYSU M77433]|uniref:nucleotidyltransferase family protein n=1 Tax=Winogradskyella sp. SYSU M77433 TaxID=3042722 RepID=UPI00247FA771|nr:nucleotidyltransferase family protein [Winogradskyella sp. SYSU M77433]MDH7911537.1 nucleotidyltransferase family protein [Winogradskyella sp. SYSU M77433]